jgi:hypothetical protein
MQPITKTTQAIGEIQLRRRRISMGTASIIYLPSKLTEFPIAFAIAAALAVGASSELNPGDQQQTSFR